jgi:hypothetical protein
MSTTLTINQMKASIGWDYETVLAYGNAATISSFAYSKTLANGSGAGNANKIGIVLGNGATGASATIAASGSVTFDLTAFTDPFGTSLSFTLVRAIYLENLNTTANTIIDLGGGVSNPWVGAAQMLNGTTPSVRVYPNGTLFCTTTAAASWVVDSTHKTIKITNEDSSLAASYRLIVIGE